jgi:uncharacterized SAM-binding protein YcdF (DUF218 family)
MKLFLSKLLQILFSPLGLGLLFILLALLAGAREPWRRLLLVSAFLVIACGSSPFVADRLCGSLERQYPHRRPVDLPSAQAIVVLGGGWSTVAGIDWETAQEIRPENRLVEAMCLYQAGKAPLIVLSGGKVPIYMGGSRTRTQVDGGLDTLRRWHVPDLAILRESNSETTRQNAVDTGDLLRSQGIRRILLVTSAVHMPRARAAFRKVGLDPIEAPAPPDLHDRRAGFWFELLPDPSALGRSTQAVKEWTGLWSYRLRGWA